MRVSRYAFRRATAADLAMIAGWIQTPDVAQWWVEADGSPAPLIDEDDLAAPDMRAWIVSLGGEPFAYLQDYDPHAWPGHHFAHLPPGSRGIDQFIGMPAMIGGGHGSAFIRAFVDGLFAAGVPALGTDPHPTNARAIRAYAKAGFAPVRECETEWGRCLLMERFAPT